MQRRRFLKTLLAGAAGLLMPKVAKPAAVIPDDAWVRMHANYNHNQDLVAAMRKAGGGDVLALFNRCQPGLLDVKAFYAGQRSWTFPKSSAD